MQIKAKALARIMRNVDRAVLVEAIEIAEFSDLFLTFEREVLIELGQVFNFMANFHVFGVELFDRQFDEIFELIDRKYEEAPAVVKLFLDVAIAVIHTLKIVFAAGSEGIEIPSEFKQDLNFIIDQLGLILEIMVTIQSRPTYEFSGHELTRMVDALTSATRQAHRALLRL